MYKIFIMVLAKPRGGLLAKEERTGTDMKRERRKKKKRQRAKKIDQEAKEKAMLKTNPDGTVKYNKKQVAKSIEKATKEGKIKKVCGYYFKCFCSYFMTIYHFCSWKSPQQITRL